MEKKKLIDTIMYNSEYDEKRNILWDLLHNLDNKELTEIVNDLELEQE